MATRIIRKSWIVDDVLTNVTTAKMSDPDGNYGVKETVSGDIITADGTAMTEVSTGVYEHSFTDEANIAYTAYMEVVYDGTTYHFEIDVPARTATVATSTAAGGRYEKSTAIQPPILLTYRDLIDHLRDYSGSLAQGTEMSRARNAIQTAYREVGTYRAWHYYHTLERINLEAMQKTGTMAYDSASGIATMASDTFPSSARYWRMTIGSDPAVYKIAEYVSSTTVLLDPILRPQADIDATTFVLWRSIYPLPGDIASLDEINDESSMWGATYIEASDWLRRERHLGGSSEPFYWTVLSSSDQFAGMAIALHGYPSSADTLDYMMRRYPRRLRFDGYGKYSSQGTATIGSLSADSATVTITPGDDAIALRADIVDAVFRTSDSGASEPPENIGAENQYSEQDIIKSLTNATTFVLRGTATFGKLGDHFTISDPVDMAPYMLTILKRRCEYEYEILKGDTTKATIAKNRYEKAALEAVGRDVRMIPQLSSWKSWRSPMWAWISPYS